MHQEDNVIVVIIDPRFFAVRSMAENLRNAIQELAEIVKKATDGMLQPLRDVAEKIGEEIATFIEELKKLIIAPPKQKRPERDLRITSILVLHQDRVTWYTSGFQ